VQSPFRRPREPSIILAVIAVFLLVALLKPWSFGENGASNGQLSDRGAIPIPSGSEQAADGQPSLAATPTVLGPNTMACLTDATEQVVILERWAGHEVRSWVAAADMTASGPLDERLEPIPFFSTHVIGLGICAPRTGSGTQQPAARLVDVTSIVKTADGPLAVDLGVPDPITLQMGGSEPASLYGAPRTIPPEASVGPSRLDAGASPPTLEMPRQTSATGVSTPSGGLAPWPTGSYAIAFQFPSAGSHIIHWLRIDLIQGAGASG
jgi:hypothetical protein